MTGEAPLQSVCVCVAVRDFSLSNRTLRVRKYTTYYQIVGTYELCTPPPSGNTDCTTLTAESVAGSLGARQRLCLAACTRPGTGGACQRRLVPPPIPQYKGHSPGLPVAIAKTKHQKICILSTDMCGSH